ncbi:MAG TPA: MurR/RpiR family transcriptional regulator [Trebonia sp.]|nr:MurR/RpiR family transcriptional regulator [Trebonia sp.]
MQPVDDLDVTTDVRQWLGLLFQRHRLSPAHRQIARFLVEHPDEAVYLTSSELAQRAQVSQPSVTRFAVALGFSGYPELRGEVRSRMLSQAAPGPSAVGPGDAWQNAIAADVLNLQQLGSSPWAAERLERIGRGLAESRPLLVLGLRVSRPLAELFVYFARKVHPDVRLVPAGSEGEDMLARARDAGATWLLAFGMPRYPSQLLPTMHWARTLGLRVALLTDSPVSPLAAEADDLLAAPVHTELTFDSLVGPLALTMGLLQVLVDAQPADAQRRLDEFDQHAADRRMFLT